MCACVYDDDVCDKRSYYKQANKADERVQGRVRASLLGLSGLGLTLVSPLTRVVAVVSGGSIRALLVVPLSRVVTVVSGSLLTLVGPLTRVITVVGSSTITLLVSPLTRVVAIVSGGSTVITLNVGGGNRLGALNSRGGTVGGGGRGSHGKAGGGSADQKNGSFDLHVGRKGKEEEEVVQMVVKRMVECRGRANLWRERIGSTDG